MMTSPAPAFDPKDFVRNLSTAPGVYRMYGAQDELLYVAIAQVKAMFESGYRAPAKRTFPVAGRNVKATLQSTLINMRDGGFISAYDFKIGAMIADLRALDLARVGPERAARMYRHYIEMKVEAIDLGRPQLLTRRPVQRGYLVLQAQVLVDLVLVDGFA